MYTSQCTRDFKPTKIWQIKTSLKTFPLRENGVLYAVQEGWKRDTRWHNTAPEYGCGRSSYGVHLTVYAWCQAYIWQIKINLKIFPLRENRVLYAVQAGWKRGTRWHDTDLIMAVVGRVIGVHLTVYAGFQAYYNMAD